MLRGSYQGVRHTFISLYEMQPDSWPYIIQQTSNIISSGMFEVQALKEIKPFVIYILCYGMHETRTSLLSILMGKLNSVKNPLIIDWLLEALLWQHQHANLPHQVWIRNSTLYFFAETTQRTLHAVSGTNCGDD